MLKDCTMIEALHCNETDKLVDVAKMLREHLIRYIYVVNANEEPVGVISVTDVNNRVVAEGKDPNTTTAKDIMTTPIKAFDEKTDERQVYQECVKSNIATCPVTHERKLVGMVTIHELIRSVTHVQ